MGQGSSCRQKERERERAREIGGADMKQRRGMEERGWKKGKNDRKIKYLHALRAYRKIRCMNIHVQRIYRFCHGEK